MAKTPSKPTSVKSATSKAKPKTAAKTTKKATSLRSKTKAVSTRPTAARKTAIKPAAIKPVVTPIKPVKDDGAELSKKELVERIVTESGVKKSEVRTVLDATLRVLADALNSGTGIAAAPMGKIKIARSKETPNGKLVVCRVKLKDRGKDQPKDPLAKLAK